MHDKNARATIDTRLWDDIAKIDKFGVTRSRLGDGANAGNPRDASEKGGSGTVNYCYK